jgi:hypothetical protein
VLAEQVKGGAGGSQWQQGTRWLSGLRDAEVEEVERRWSLTFPPDYRFFLRRLHTVDRPRLRASYLAEGEQSQDASGVRAATFIERYRQYMVLQDGPSFYNWLTDTEALQGQFAWLWEGLQFDIEHDVAWRQSWGPKPATLEEQNQRVRALVEAAPKLFPVFSHRYLLAEPCVAGNPVLSVYQSDIIIYGNDLRDYLLAEFGDILGLDVQQRESLKHASYANFAARQEEFASIPFWGEIIFNP